MEQAFNNSNSSFSSNMLFNLFLIFLYFPCTAADNFSLIYSNTSFFIQGGNTSKPGCPTKCGHLTVPYPFGIGTNSGCAVDPFFAINCDASFDPPKAFLNVNDTLEILGIYETKIHIKNRVASGCYPASANQSYPSVYTDISMNLSPTPFTFSDDNKLTVLGCDDVAYVTVDDGSDTDYPDYISACVAVCSKPEDLSNGVCAGIGCCQASVTKGLKSVYATMDSLNQHSKVHNFSSCGYAFLAEQNAYIFNESDIFDSSLVTRVMETIPLVLDWGIGNQSCSQNNGATICKNHSVCVDSGTDLGGYRCNCSQGFQGNPYLDPGCIDINECMFQPCVENAVCLNRAGSFSCICPPEHNGDGTKHGTGCNRLPLQKKFVLYIGLLVGLGLFLLLTVILWLYKMLKKRRVKHQKKTLFIRNGGLLLQQQMSAEDRVLEKMRIFTSKELEKATDRFNGSRVLGQGGQGTVYKGMLSDGRIVAVKRSKHVNKNQLEEFINEVVVLSQVNHRNVVKLLGCCLETDVPLLVYEFIPNGTLYHLIHAHDIGIPFSWEIRLTIAAHIANALSYLHHATCVPIYHRDMKSTNILLDEKYRAKLSDFGLSKSFSQDQTHLTTNVKGTFGYLDPEYFQTGRFTEKSDVYSFGVVLVELLTGQKPIATNTTKEEERSLVSRFLLRMEHNQLDSILDFRMIEQGVTQAIIDVSNLASRCLNFNGKKRPKIGEVAMELESIRASENPSIIQSVIHYISDEDTDSFVLTDDSTSRTESIDL